MQSPDDFGGINDGVTGWPAFVDLMAATALLFVVLLGVVLAWAGVGRGGDIKVQTQLLADSLRSLSSRLGGEPVFEVDSTQLLVVRVTFLADATFPSGRYELKYLKEPAKIALDSIVEALQSQSLSRTFREVRVVGHSDQDPVRDSTGRISGDFSNWELAASRAAVVARYLDELGLDPCKISATGHGAYYPAAPPPENSQPSEEAKRMNRRIELEFVPTAFRARDGAEGSRGTECYKRGDGAHVRPTAGGGR